MEPDLKELKEQVETISEEKEVVKVKLFRCIGDNTHDGKQMLENEINEFLSTMDPWYVEYVNTSVVKNFLPMTNMGEYQEVWYGMVHYREIHA